MNRELNFFGCPLLYVDGEESTRKGKTRKKHKEGRVTEQGMVKVISSCKPMMCVDNSKTNGPSKVTIIFCLSLKPRM